MIVAIIACGYFVGVVMVVTTVVGVMGDVVNVGEVVGTGISVDVMDVTAES
jgi:hypothetical protein